MKPRFVLLAAALLAWCVLVESRPQPGTSGKHNEDLDGIGADLEDFLNHKDNSQNTRQRESQNVYSGNNRNNNFGHKRGAAGALQPSAAALIGALNPSSILSSILGNNGNRPFGSSGGGSSSSVVRPSYPSAPASAPAPRPAYPSAPAYNPAPASAPAASRPLYPSLPASDTAPSAPRPSSSGSAPYPAGGGWMMPQSPAYPSYPSNSAPARNPLPYPSYPSNSAPARNPAPYPSYPSNSAPARNPPYPSYPTYNGYQQSYPSYSNNRQSGYPASSGSYPAYSNSRPYPVQQSYPGAQQRYDTRRGPPPPPGPATPKPSKSITSRISNFFKKIVN